MPSTTGDCTNKVVLCPCTAGTADVASGDGDVIGGAVAARDAGIRAWFEAQVRTCLMVGTPQDKALALARHVCALKLAHGQLVAGQAAAAKRAAAAQLANATLQAALDDAEAAMERVRERVRDGGSQNGVADPQVNLTHSTPESFFLCVCVCVCVCVCACMRLASVPAYVQCVLCGGGPCLGASRMTGKHAMAPV
jgi:hypothetical protein